LALASLYLSAEILNVRPTRELIAKAREAAGKALALDDKSAEAHALLGSLTARHEYNWAAAERHFRDALELDPNSAFTHNELAQNVLAWRMSAASSAAEL
jgi:eukaryotic-like serine/threonine-protein kinase